MAYEHKPGKGSIFNNGYKERDSQPDMKGTMKTPDGQEWEISGWWNEGRNGDYLAISIQEPYNRDRQAGSGDRREAASRGRPGSSGGGHGGQGRGDAGGPSRASGSSFEEQRRQMRQAGEEARRRMASPPNVDNLADDDIPF